MKTIKIYTQASKWSWENNFSLIHRTTELNSDSSQVNITLNIQEVEIEEVVIDTAELVDAEVSQIEQLKQELLAKTQVTIDALDEKIQSLLAIEDKS